eukprot:7433326-Ditylum_brightwellii.AAC.1
MGLFNVLETFGHPQQPTKIKTENKTTNSFVHYSMSIKHNKSWGMQWHWLKKATLQKALEIWTRVPGMKLITSPSTTCQPIAE